MPDRGEREAFLTADANAEMIEQIERFPRVRERAALVGEPDDIVPDAFGADLPLIRGWTEAHYDFAGHVTGFDPGELGDREALGYGADERACIVAARARASAPRCCGGSSTPSPRRPPARALRRRAVHELRQHGARGDRRGDRARGRLPGRCRPTVRPGPPR